MHQNRWLAAIAELEADGPDETPVPPPPRGGVMGRGRPQAGAPATCRAAFLAATWRAWSQAGT